MITESELALRAKTIASNSKQHPAYREWIRETAIPMREELASGVPLSDFRGELLERFVDGSIRCLVEETGLRATTVSRFD